jgi:hypothetical protein
MQLQTELSTSDLTVVDPGDAGTIPAQAGVCLIVTGGAETRTLAAPSRAGTHLHLCMKTDDGNAVITVGSSGTVNETGNNTITFANTGEYIGLISVHDGTNYMWRVCGEADGASLSTV